MAQDDPAGVVYHHVTPGTGTYITHSLTNLDHKKHIRVARDGTAWTNETIRIRADDIPARSWDGSTPTRTVYVAVFWEDEARDDANGPNDCVDHVCP